MRSAAGRRLISPSLALAGLTLTALACQAGPTATSPTVASAVATTAPPAATAAPVATTTPTELAAREVPVMNAAMPSGRYTSSVVTPRITFEVDNLAWYAGPQTDGFFAVLRSAGGSDFVIVRFIEPTAINAGPESTVDATTAPVAIQTLQANSELVILGTSDSLMSGQKGSVIELEGSSSQPQTLLSAGAVRFVLEPGLRAWVAFFDTPDGLLAIMVQGSGAAWERDLGLAEPLLETVTIGR